MRERRMKKAKSVALVASKDGQSSQLLSKIEESSKKSRGMAFTSVKLVAVGDGGVGKTSLLVSYAEGRFPKAYVPTVFDNFETMKTVDDSDYLVCLWDTAGQEEYAHLRPISYPETDVFLICFSFGNERSLRRVERWKEEIQEQLPGVPFILVGNKSDLRSAGRISQSQRELEEFADEIGAIGYVECSAKEMLNVNQVFDMALEYCIENGKGSVHETPEDNSVPTSSEGLRCMCSIQ